MSMAQVVDLCSSDESDDDGEGHHSRGPTLPVLSVPGGRQRTRPVPSKVRGEELFGMVYYAIDDDAHDVDFEEEDQKMPAFPGLPPPPPPPVWHRKRPRRDVIDLSSTAATTTMMTTTTAGPIVPSSAAAQMYTPAYQVLLEKVQPPPTTTTTGPFIPPSAAAAAAAHNISTPSWPVVVEKVVQPCKATTPRERVLEVFPDVATDHVDKLLRDCLNSVEMVTSILSDGSYPKSKREDGQMGPTKMTPSAASSVLVTRQRGVKPMYNYTSVSSFQATPEYREEAVQMLLYEFPFIRVDSMRKWFREHQQRLTLVRNHILELLKKTQSRTTRNTSNQDPELLQFRALKPVWATKRPSTEQVECLGEKHCMKRFIRRPKPNLTDPILIDEVQYAQHQLEAWMEAMDEKQKRYDARTRADQVGNGVECGCCFDKVPFEEMVACKSEGHLFCMDCIQRYAETQIFSNATLGVIKATGRQACELLCCDASGCQSGFHGEHLERTLNVKTLERYTELQFRASIEGAGMSEEIWYVRVCSLCCVCCFGIHALSDATVLCYVSVLVPSADFKLIFR